MHLFGSPEKFLLVVKRNFYLLTSDLEWVVKPIIELLRECGLSARDIAKMCVPNSRLLTSYPNRLQGHIHRRRTLRDQIHSDLAADLWSSPSSFSAIPNPSAS